MITKVSLRNFKGIVSGDIELSPLTIIVGPNNSGKTSILEALLLSHGLGELFNGLRVLDLLMELHRVLDSKSLKHLIYNYGSNVDRVCIGYHINGKKAVLLIIPTKYELAFHVAKDVDIDEIMKLDSKDLKRFESIAKLTYDGRGPHPTSPLFIKRVFFMRYDILEKAHRFLYLVWEDLISRGITSEVAKWISKVVTEEFIDLTAEPFGGRPCINLYRSDKVRIRLGDLGDGVHMLVIARLVCEY